jgi:CRP-like cAMP-binding protein
MSAVDSSMVAHLHLFESLDTSACEAILREAHSIRVPRNKVVFEQGEDVHSFYLLLHGHIRATKLTPAGEQVIVRYVATGEIFGIGQAIGLSTYPATAKAVDDSVILVWPTTVWTRLVAAYPALAANTLKTVGSRLQEAHTRVVEMSTQQVEQRIAHALLRLVDKAGRKTAQGIEIDFQLSRQDIAEMTGATVFTVSRTLSTWEQRGLIKSSRQRIALREPETLRALADATPGDADA